MSDGVLGSQTSMGVSQEEVDASMHDISHDGAVAAEEDAITKNDAWHVITAYFDEKGLVRQQLDR